MLRRGAEENLWPDGERLLPPLRPASRRFRPEAPGGEEEGLEDEERRSSDAGPPRAHPPAPGLAVCVLTAEGAAATDDGEREDASEQWIDTAGSEVSGG